MNNFYMNKQNKGNTFKGTHTNVYSGLEPTAPRIHQHAQQAYVRRIWSHGSPQ